MDLRFSLDQFTARFCCLAHMSLSRPWGQKTPQRNGPAERLVLYADDCLRTARPSPHIRSCKRRTSNRPRPRARWRLYENCVTRPICGISPRVFLFNRANHVRGIGCFGFTLFQNLVAKTYPGILRENGYFVGHVGKLAQREIPAENFGFGTVVLWQTLVQGNPVVRSVRKKRETTPCDFSKTRPNDKPFLFDRGNVLCHPRRGQVTPIQFFAQPQSMSLYNDVGRSDAAQRDPRIVFDPVARFRRQMKRTRTQPLALAFRSTPEKYQRIMKKFIIDSRPKSTRRADAFWKQLEAQGVLDRLRSSSSPPTTFTTTRTWLADIVVSTPREHSCSPSFRSTNVGGPARQNRTTDFTLSNLPRPTNSSPRRRRRPTTDARSADMRPVVLERRYRCGCPMNVNWRDEFFYEPPNDPQKNFIPYSEALVRKGLELFLSGRESTRANSLTWSTIRVE